jgi:hypothetical protein
MSVFIRACLPSVVAPAQNAPKQNDEVCVWATPLSIILNVGRSAHVSHADAVR